MDGAGLGKLALDEVGSIAVVSGSHRKKMMKTSLSYALSEFTVIVLAEVHATAACATTGIPTAPAVTPPARVCSSGVVCSYVADVAR